MALLSAIESRGLGLERIATRLAERGAPVSKATLSYWQTGRSQPERATSLQALDELEAILELPEGSLHGLLDHPRPRGRPSDPAMTFVDAPTVVPHWDALEEIFLEHAGRMRLLSVDDTMHIVGRRSSHQDIRQVVRAEVDGVDRFPVVHFQESPGSGPPQIEARSACTTRVVDRPQHDLLIAEVVLDAPLRRGETAAVAFRLEINEFVTDCHERRDVEPVRQLALEVRFDPDDLPKRVTRMSLDGVRERVVPVDVRPDGSVHLVELNFSGGCGFRWRW